MTDPQPVAVVPREVLECMEEGRALLTKIDGESVIITDGDEYTYPADLAAYALALRGVVEKIHNEANFSVQDARREQPALGYRGSLDAAWILSVTSPLLRDDA